MPNRLRFILLGALTGLQFLTIRPVFAANAKSCRAFDETARKAYIAETSTSNLVSFDGPKLLRSVPIYGAKWERPPITMIDQPNVLTRLEGPWGHAQLLTQLNESKGVSIRLNPSSTNQILNETQIQTLQKLYPNLEIEHRPTRSQIRMTLIYREDDESRDAFEATARSLVNTLFNDPKGILGLYPEAD